MVSQLLKEFFYKENIFKQITTVEDYLLLLKIGKTRVAALGNNYFL